MEDLAVQTPIVELSEEPKRPKVYLDDGSTGVKVAYFNSEGVLVRHTVSNNAELGNCFTENSATYQVGGQDFTFYSGCDALSTNNFHFQYSDHACASVHHALHSLGFSGELDIVATLPIKEFYLGTSHNTENIEKKKAALMREAIPENGDPIIIKSVSIWPEGIPALAPHLTDKDGNPTVGENDYSVVFDMGGNSIDCVAFVGCADTIIRADSFSTGMIECYPIIRTELKRSIRTGHVKELLETGQCLKGKYTIDRTKITKGLMNRAVNQIISFLGDDLDKDFLSNIFVIGGGAELLAAALKEAEFDCQIISDPTLALVSAIASLDQGE